jgi:hypothetical protein
MSKWLDRLAALEAEKLSPPPSSGHPQNPQKPLLSVLSVGSDVVKAEIRKTDHGRKAERLVQRKTSERLSDMVLCRDCRNLGANGICAAAAAGVMSGVWRRYSPAVDPFGRCERFVRRTVH